MAEGTRQLEVVEVERSTRQGMPGNSAGTTVLLLADGELKSPPVLREAGERVALRHPLHAAEQPGQALGAVRGHAGGQDGHEGEDEEVATLEAPSSANATSVGTPMEMTTTPPSASPVSIVNP